jgi:haloalkane dehalogenase
LPDFPYDAHDREVDGLRLAHLDEGEGPPVLLLRGEPTWSFLWRHAIPPLEGLGSFENSPEARSRGPR